MRDGYVAVHGNAQADIDRAALVVNAHILDLNFLVRLNALEDQVLDRGNSDAQFAQFRLL